MQDNEKDTSLWFTALYWQIRGFGILPCQPGKKRLVAGFGPRREVIRNEVQIEFWFRDRSANLAVVCPQDVIILDFDDSALYDRFRDRWPEIARSYSEHTPGGGAHVWLRFAEPLGSDPIPLVPGLEVKRVTLVAPSQIGGTEYIRQGGEILKIDLRRGLDGFLEILEGKSSPTRKWIVRDSLMVRSDRENSRVGKIKQAWPILSYLAVFAPDLVLTKSGRFRSGRCPWHDDRKPSLWIDTKNNTWGCHACAAHGDIINWEACRLGGVKMSEAIRSLEEASRHV